MIYFDYTKVCVHTKKWNGKDMKTIKRDAYLEKLKIKMGNGLIKVLCGMRRVGKSFLLDPLFKDYLISIGIKKDHIIKLELDKNQNKKYRNPVELDNFIKSQIKDNKMYYILLDEIQLVEDFEGVLNGFLYEKNLDIYVTGSNSKFLSSDIITEFRGRSDEIKVYPLSFSEFMQVSKKDKKDALDEYMTYGGMPLILNNLDHSSKNEYLNTLFKNTYLNDIVNRYNIQRPEILDMLVDILCSSVGSLTNPTNLVNVFTSNGYKDLNVKTVASYLGYLEDAFIIKKANRYDIKGKKTISTPLKYYFTDIGIRNAKLNFRNQEQNHIMENIIYNELLRRGYNVDVGVIEKYDKNEDDKTIRKTYEIDFVANKGFDRFYIQVAYDIEKEEKKKQEILPLASIYDNFKKIIIVKDVLIPYKMEDGILVLGLIDFLLDEQSLDR